MTKDPEIFNLLVQPIAVSAEVILFQTRLTLAVVLLLPIAVYGSERLPEADTGIEATHLVVRRITR